MVREDACLSYEFSVRLSEGVLVLCNNVCLSPCLSQDLKDLQLVLCANDQPPFFQRGCPRACESDCLSVSLSEGLHVGL